MTKPASLRLYPLIYFDRWPTAHTTWAIDEKLNQSIRSVFHSIYEALLSPQLIHKDNSRTFNHETGC